MIYLDNSATTWPKPESVYKAVYDCMKNYGANPGRSGHKMAIKAAQDIYECREFVSRFFGLDNAENVVFTQNATHGLNIVIKGILNPGDHIICTAMDHNSILRTVYSMREDIEYTIVNADKTGQIDVSYLESLVKPNTKLIAMTHVSNVCGTILPIEKVSQMCKKHNILFLLDASQSAGILDIDMKRDNIDYLCAPGHKALYGPMGTGILLINSKVIPKPLYVGGTGSNSASLSQPDILPDRLESGTLNLPGICGLYKGMEFISQIGIENIRNQENELTCFLIDGLSEMKNFKIAGLGKSDYRTGVVSFCHTKKDCVEISQYLDSEYNIATRSMYHCAYLAHKALGTGDTGTVRVSLGAFNTKSHIDTLLCALSKI